MLRITIEPAANFTQLGQRWRALEERAEPGFFRSWTFLGCLAEERFADALLLSATQDGADVALALLGTAGRKFWLNQTGHATQDTVFIEHNGMLAARGQEHAAAASLRAAARRGGTLMLSGVDEAALSHARDAGWLTVQQSRSAPYVDIGALTGPFLASLSGNTRAQIRRSQRFYGPDLHAARAATLEEAQAWFSEMVSLHGAAWARRGLLGAFWAPDVLRFHRALIARAWPSGQTDLLRVRASGRTIGLLYCFLQQGRVLSYQSGFAYDAQNPHAKPGLVSHALAIEHYAARGERIYDLLAGADRYKTSLARQAETLHWASLHRPWSQAGLAGRLRRLSQAVRTRLGARR